MRQLIKGLILSPILLMALISCKESPAILEDNRDFLEDNFKHTMAFCKVFFANKTKKDTPFQNHTPLTINQYNDQVFAWGWDGVGMKSPADTLILQGSYCNDYKWHPDQKTLFQDSLLASLTDTVNPAKAEAYRIYPYKKSPSKFHSHIKKMKQIKYVLVHEQLSYKKGQASKEGYTSGHYHTRLSLFDWKTFKNMGVKTLKISNSSTVSFSKERHVEIWDDENESEIPDKVIDLGNETQRLQSALNTDLYSRTHDMVSEALNGRFNTESAQKESAQ